MKKNIDLMFFLFFIFKKLGFLGFLFLTVKKKHWFNDFFSPRSPPSTHYISSMSSMITTLHLAPSGVLYLVVLHLVPRSAGHTTCSGLRPTTSCGQGSAYLLHIAPPPAGTTSCAIDHGHLLYLGGSAPRYYILCCKNTTLLHIGGRPPGSAPPP